MKKILTLILVIVSFALNAQQEINNHRSPGGIFDTVYDRFGGNYPISDILIDTTTLDDNGSPKSVLLCQPGYFDLYFEQGSGMEISSNPVHQSRRNVICQVLSDISAFLPPPTGTPLSNGTLRVNIWIRSVSQLIPDPQSSGVEGLASSFYVLPAGSQPRGGIVNGEIGNTIISGYNSFTNVSSPIITANQTTLTSNFYHGLMAFNFSNPGLTWELNPGSTTTSLTDLYSVALHEITHALGFTSLINVNGLSRFGINYPYYSKYDLFLRNGNGGLPLITPQNSNYLSYDYVFNPALSTAVLTPQTPGCTNSGSSDNTPCPTALWYNGSVNVPIYTPACYEAGSSLSHFEDQCFPVGSPAGNNSYFAMSNAQHPGAIKRYLKSEERRTLCDLGYTVNPTYGSASFALTQFNYNTSPSQGISVGGINDGITPAGNYLYTTIAGGPPYTVNCFGVQGFLTNDFNASSYESLEVIYGGGTVSASFGSIGFSFISATSGLTILRYIPVGSNNINGNITYIYIYTLRSNFCNPKACNIVPNGNFEQYSALPTSFSQLHYTCGWQNANAGTADYYHAGTQFGNPGLKVPCNIMGYEGDNQNGSGYVGMGDFNTSKEMIFIYLTGPMESNANYQFSIDASLAESFSNRSFPLQVYFAENYMPYSGNGPIPITAPLQHFYLGDVSSYNGWTNYTINFTTGPEFQANAIVIGNLNGQAAQSTGMPLAPYPASCNYTNPANQTGYSYIYVDNVFLSIAAASTFTPPSPVCQNQTIILNNYVSIPGGTFTGPGVTNNAGIWTFNASAAGIGNHTIVYSYISNVCNYTVAATIQVVPDISLSATASPASINCQEQSTLTASGANTYVWNPGNFTGNPYIVSPMTTTTYTVTGTNSVGCTATATVTVNISNPSSLCCNPATIFIPDGETSANVSIPANSFVEVAGLFTINSNLTLSNCTLRMAPNAKIDILSGNTLTLLGCRLFSCTAMWQGIYSNPGANLITDQLSQRTLIEDAVNAVYSVNGGGYDLQGTTFNKNHTSIFCNLFNGTHPGIVRSCFFNCTATGSSTPGSVLKAPYLNQVSRFGIMAENNSDITFGVAGGTFNVFQNLQIGVHAIGSKVKLYHNSFQNIYAPSCLTTPTGPPCPVAGWGVWVKSSALTAGSADNSIHTNVFLSCFNGILAEDNSIPAIIYNSFTNITNTCIYIRNNPGENGGAVVTDNTFNNFRTGIFYQNNDFLFCTILRNYMKAFNTFNGTAIFLQQNATHPVLIKKNVINDLNTSGAYGIRVQNAVQGSTLLRIEENTIRNIRHGIWVTNYPQAQVKNHNANYTSIASNLAGIFYPDAVPTAFSVGIKMENSPGANVFKNYVEKTITDPVIAHISKLYGISIDTDGNGTIVRENLLARLGTGMNFYGTPNAPLHTSCNNMYRNRIGLSLDNTYIGDQGFPAGSPGNGFAQDNQWSIPGSSSGGWLGASRVGSSPASTWHTRSNSLPFFPNQTLQMSPTSAISSNLVPSAPYTCSFGCPNPPCTYSGEVMKMMVKGPPFDNLNPGLDFMVSYGAYRMIREDTIYTWIGEPHAPVFLNYIKIHSSTNIGRLYAFSEKLSNGDTLGAIAENNAVVPASIPEENQKKLNNIFYYAWAKGIFEFTSADSLTLYNIAIQHPHEGGMAVYDARVMLEMDEYDYAGPGGESNKTGGNGTGEAGTGIAGTKSSNDPVGIFYPNPATSQVFYETGLEEKESGRVIITDLLGNEFNAQKLAAGFNQVSFDVSGLASGLYLYKVIINGTQVAADRFIINK